MSGYSAITGDYLILETNLANYSDVSDSSVANGSRISIKSGRGSSSKGIIFVGQTSDPTSKSPAGPVTTTLIVPIIKRRCEILCRSSHDVMVEIIYYLASSHWYTY